MVVVVDQDPQQTQLLVKELSLGGIFSEVLTLFQATTEA